MGIDNFLNMTIEYFEYKYEQWTTSKLKKVIDGIIVLLIVFGIPMLFAWFVGTKLYLFLLENNCPDVLANLTSVITTLGVFWGILFGTKYLMKDYEKFKRERKIKLAIRKYEIEKNARKL